MKSKTISFIALIGVAFMLAEAKPFEEIEDDRFVDTNGACNCSRQTGGECAVTKSLCLFGGKQLYIKLRDLEEPLLKRQLLSTNLLRHQR